MRIVTANVEDAAIWDQAAYEGGATAVRKQTIAGFREAIRWLSLRSVSFRDRFSDTHTNVQQRGLYGGWEGGRGYRGTLCRDIFLGIPTRTKADARLKRALKGTSCSRHGVVLL